jgi:hypothetical protein
VLDESPLKREWINCEWINDDLTGEAIGVKVQVGEPILEAQTESVVEEEVKPKRKRKTE